MLKYHEQTKHSYYSIRNYPNRLDWDNQPSVLKIYNQFLKLIKLDGENPLHNFIYRLGGITAKKRYPGVEYYLRTIPSAGALYPVEIYFQARSVEGLEDGIYHFDVANSAIKLLYRIDEDEGVEGAFKDNRKIEGLVVLFSTLYYRSSWKYKKRAFRYCLLDAGHALGGMEASSFLYEKGYVIRYLFDKERLNHAFGLGEGEFFLSSAVVGKPMDVRVECFEMQLEDINPPFEKSEEIEAVYQETLQISSCTHNYGYQPFTFGHTAFEETIFRRRSIREFTTSTISKVSFDAIMETVNRPILSDCDAEVKVYTVVNAVDGMDRGVYLDGKCLKEGDFRQKAGYLCLEQALGAQSAVTFFLTTSSGYYQQAYQKAGHIGHRLYLASEYLHIGCSGIGAYYDDEVSAFLGCDEDEMILYGVTIGV